MTVYEFPLNERIRIWLRLADLFDKTLYFCRSSDSFGHHAGLLAIFETVDVLARSEIKTELLQELERQKQGLEALRANPQVDTKRLADVLGKVAEAQTALLAMTGKMGQHIRDNEWLAGIKGRACIPGGACSFDLPVYHFWLNRPAEARRADLMAWLAPMLPVKQAVDVVLKLLRESGHVSEHVAVQGQFQLMLGGRTAQMLRIASDAECAPEVSANKYAVNIRFMLPDTVQKPHVCEQDVAFELVFCNF
jgi:cell division protein ZapD